VSILKLEKKMSELQKSTLKKILREQFKGEIPIVKHDLEKKALITEIKHKLSTIEGCRIVPYYLIKFHKILLNNRACNFLDSPYY
jgi:hypothetical protein